MVLQLRCNLQDMHSNNLHCCQYPIHDSDDLLIIYVPHAPCRAASCPVATLTSYNKLHLVSRFIVRHAKQSLRLCAKQQVNLGHPHLMQ